jgi:nitrate/nitrite transport system substrate-binding protein
VWVFFWLKLEKITKSIAFLKNVKGKARQLRLSAIAVTCSISLMSLVGAVQAEPLGWPEKEELKFGFIKLTDMAPLAVAYEKGYFEAEGLYVILAA